MEYLYVIAKNYNQAKEFAKSQHCPPSKLRHMNSPESVMGLRGITVYRINNWYESEDACKANDYLLTRTNVSIIDVTD